MNTTTHTRRDYLAGASAATVTVLAGCAGEGADNEPESPEEALGQQTRSGFDERDTWVKEISEVSIQGEEDSFEVYTVYTFDYINGGPVDVREQANIVSTSVFSSVFQSDFSVDHVGINAQVPTVNEYGEESMSLFHIVKLSADTAERIVWENFSAQNLGEIADIYEFDGSYFAD